MMLRMRDKAFNVVKNGGALVAAEGAAVLVHRNHVTFELVWTHRRRVGLHKTNQSKNSAIYATYRAQRALLASTRLRLSFVAV